MSRDPDQIPIDEAQDDAIAEVASKVEVNRDVLGDLAERVFELEIAPADPGHAPGDIRRFGAVPNDTTKGVENNAALLAAIAAGEEVVVSGVYYVTPTVGNPISRSVSIRGERGAKLIFDAPVYSWFVLGDIDHFVSDRVDFVNASDGGVTIAETISNAYIGRLDVRGNFDGDIRFFYGRFSRDTNPAVETYGIRSVRIADSTIRNNGNIFFHAPDMPFRSMWVTDNTVSEMGRILINLGRSNDHAFPQEIADAKQHLVVEGNSVINTEIRETTKGMYLCFVLFEGDKFTYHGNHVEGLCTHEVKEVYDIYTNGSDLDYRGNTWKNIMCFNAGKAGADLMKGKGAKRRVYDGNTFIVEKPFVEKHGGSVGASDSHVSLVGQVQIGEFIARNNDIQVYDLRGMGSAKWTGFTFENNRIRADHAENTLLNIVNDNPGIDPATTDIRIVRNDVRIATTSSSWRLFSMDDPDPNYAGFRSIVIDDNFVSLDHTTRAWFVYNASWVKAGFVSMRRNVFDVRQQDHTKREFMKYTFSKADVLLQDDNYYIGPDRNVTEVA